MKPKEPKQKKALLYARVANLDQDYQLKHQVSELQTYCQKNNIEVVGIYYEKASGFNFDRLEFQYLLYDIKMQNAKADLLLFTTWDRFSRNPTETKKMKEKLRELKVKPKAIKD